MGDYSKHFSHQELYDSNDVPPAAHQLNLRALALGLLDPLRDAAGHPLIVTSGYRGLLHNQSVGGAKASRHQTGEAADVCDALGKISGLELFYLAAQLPPKVVKLPTGETRAVQIGGLGLYHDERTGGKFIHVDTRPRINGCITTWYFDGRDYVALPAYVRAELRRLKVHFT